MSQPKTRGRALRAVISVVMALAFALCSMLVPASALVKKSKVDNSTIPFDPKITTQNSDWKNFAVKVAEEGTVLLKNKNNTLPLAKGKINLLGYCAYNPIYGGAGSGMADSSNAYSIVQSLQDAGYE